MFKFTKKSTCKINEKEQIILAINKDIKLLEEAKIYISYIELSGTAEVVAIKQQALKLAESCKMLLLQCLDLYTNLLSPRSNRLNKRRIVEGEIIQILNKLDEILPNCKLRYMQIEKEVLPLINQLYEKINICSEF